MTKVRFFDPEYIAPDKLTYSVIAGMLNGKWIFVRHRDRSTFEIAGGHIEEGETAGEAARREFNEETGAIDFKIECIATYSVEKDSETGWGRFYFAEVESFGPIPDMSEIAEVKLLDNMPENLTHPDIQPHLFKKADEYIRKK